MHIAKIKRLPRREPYVERAFTLSDDCAKALAIHCIETGDRPIDIIEDALALHFDALAAEEG
jgi:hypothetical protein